MELARLGSHSNVYQSCIGLLSEKGWQLTTIPVDYEKEDLGIISLYIANKDNTEIYAETPIELLGLASLHEYHFPHDNSSYWWTVSKNKNLFNKLEDEALERSFFEFKERDFKAWRSNVKQALLEYDDIKNGHEALGISVEKYIDLLKKYPEFNSAR